MRDTEEVLSLDNHHWLRLVQHHFLLFHDDSIVSGSWMAAFSQSFYFNSASCYYFILWVYFLSKCLFFFFFPFFICTCNVTCLIVKDRLRRTYQKAACGGKAEKCICGLGWNGRRIKWVDGWVGLVGFWVGYVDLFCFSYCGGWLQIADNYCYCLCKSNVVTLFLLLLFCLCDLIYIKFSVSFCFNNLG